jgi:hypothetical protein
VIRTRCCSARNFDNRCAISTFLCRHRERRVDSGPTTGIDVVAAWPLAVAVSTAVPDGGETDAANSA